MDPYRSRPDPASAYRESFPHSRTWPMKRTICVRLVLLVLVTSFVVGLLLPCGLSMILAFLIAGAMGAESLEVLMVVGLIPVLLAPIAAGVTTYFLLRRGVAIPVQAPIPGAELSQRTMLLAGVGATALSILLMAAWILATTS